MHIDLADCHRSQSMFPNVPGGVLDTNEPDPSYDIESFWEYYRQWLAARGIRLFHRKGGGWGNPPKHTPSGPTSFPWGIRCDDGKIDREFLLPSRLVPARDAYSRDVILKLVLTNSIEYTINQQLLRQKCLFENKTQGALPPVAILDSEHNFSFIVMPRWGDASITTLETVGQVLVCIRSLLQGLNVLHNLRIAHRDIDQQNIMTNGYSIGQFWRTFEPEFLKFRRGADVSYCLMDYDRSFQFPLGTAYEDCRLPSSESWVSLTTFRPLEFRLGELDYNPLSYDVACLGNFFRVYCSPVVPFVPLMAILLDQMTTHVTSERFTAEEALTFFEQSLSDLPDSVLPQPLEPVETWDSVNDFWDTLEDSTVYWAPLPSDFQRTWVHYQIPTFTAVEKFLHRVVAYPLGRKTLRLCRRVFCIRNAWDFYYLRTLNHLKERYIGFGMISSIQAPPE